MWNPQLYLPKSSRLKRLVKNGRTNLKYQGIVQKRQKYMRDTFTTLVEIEWHWNLLIFICAFIITWHVFAVYYYVVEVINIRYSINQAPCVTNVKSFVSALLFSIETQTTVGYGTRSVTETCPHVYLIVMLQSLVGIVSQAALAGIFIAKVKRAEKTSHTVFFSNSACLYEEDGNFYLAVRMADIRKSHTALSLHARGLVIKKQLSKSGCLPVRNYNIKMTGEGRQPYLFTAWPCTIVHKINAQSPFWQMTRDDFLNQNYELMVILEGIVATTSYPFRICVSYLPWDIAWGHRFLDLQFTETPNATTVDYENFHTIRPVKTPFSSACEIYLLRKYGQTWRQKTNNIARRSVSQFSNKKQMEADTGLGSFTVVNSRTLL